MNAQQNSTEQLHQNGRKNYIIIATNMNKVMKYKRKSNRKVVVLPEFYSQNNENRQGGKQNEHSDQSREEMDIPMCFDIIRRGNIPSIRFQNGRVLLV